MVIATIAWLRAQICRVVGHSPIALRRITPEHTMRTIRMCDRCGVEL